MADEMKNEQAPVTLSAEDAAALDAVMSDAPAADGAREERVRAWLRTLEGAEAPKPSGDLAGRTMAAIRADRMRLAPAGGGHGRGRGQWKYLKEAAAMGTAAAILVAVLIPGIAQARQSARRVACANNLAIAANAFGVYAGANGNALPCVAMPADRNWLGAGSGADDHSNAANLLPLVRGAYLAAEKLACPGRGPVAALPAGAKDLPDGFRGYSYVNLYGASRPSWDGGSGTLVLADRNPLFDAEAGGAGPNKNSANHGGHGTYVLSADGAVAWQLSPNIGPGGDNIWTLGNPEAPRILYTGTETASVAGDLFLSP